MGIREKTLSRGYPLIEATLLSGKIIKAAAAAMYKIMLNPKESSLIEKS